MVCCVLYNLALQRGEDLPCAGMEVLHVSSDKEDIKGDEALSWRKQRLHENGKRPQHRPDKADAPFPGKYPIKDFIEEGLLNPVKRTYNFKAQGRGSATTSESQSREQLAKPGQNPVALTEVGKKQSSLQDLKNPTKKKIGHNVSQKGTFSAASYNLRAPEFGKSTFKRCLYFIQLTTPFLEVAINQDAFLTNGVFASSIIAVLRRPKLLFFTIGDKMKLKEGPAPGQYDVMHQTLSQIMTSSFQSKVPRFFPTTSKTPGPGTYDPVRRTKAASGLYNYQLNT
ncbi:protein STPG4 [Carcharodon carcharias]|uniref:protein STPG4 n=1 Tax=Carcharodon carcharias TaxID=13397 RepID=UPI001B7DB079|nr:protein STPG4 [Carcharodon carcharias]